MKKTFDLSRECERTVTEESKDTLLVNWKGMNEKSVILKAIEREEESNQGEHLPLQKICHRV